MEPRPWRRGEQKTKVIRGTGILSIPLVDSPGNPLLDPKTKQPQFVGAPPKGWDADRVDNLVPGTLKGKRAEGPGGSIFGGEGPPGLDDSMPRPIQHSPNSILDVARSPELAMTPKADRRKIIHDMLALPVEGKGQFPVDTSAVSVPFGSAATQAIQRIEAWSSLRPPAVRLVVDPVMAEGEGDYSWRSRTISLSAWIPSTLAAASALVHEFGHHLEWTVLRKEVDSEFAARVFGKSRVPLTTLRKWKALAGNPKFESMLVYPDVSGVDPYAGRDYPNGQTELFSVGLEMMFQDPSRLAELDPALFLKVIDWLRGS